MADISEFDAFAHDLRHYLREIVTQTQLGIRGNPDGLHPSLLEKLNRVIQAGRSCEELVQAMSAYQGADARPDHQWPLKRLLQALSLETTAALAALNGVIRIDVSPPDADPSVPTSMQRVWRELIANALKFRRPDIPPQIVLEISLAGSRLEFLVSDNGIGIDPNHRELVLGPFRRLNTREAYHGFGLGLAICRKILLQMGGDLRVEDSAEGTVIAGWCELPG